MRIRTFIAESMEAAISDIRNTLGPDAIIISTYESPRGRGVEVRAAVEDINIPDETFEGLDAPHLPIDDDLEKRLRLELFGEMKSEITARNDTDENAKPAARKSASAPARENNFDYEVRPDGWVKTGIAGLLKAPLGSIKKKPGKTKDRQVELLDEQSWCQEELSEPLAFHNVPDPLRANLIRAASAMDAEDATLALGAALDARLTMDPIPSRPARPIILVGAPGSGKTVTTAKLAAQAVLAGAKVCLITTDSLRAGALAQLQAFADIMQVKLHAAETCEALAEIVAEHKDHAIFIDTPATNPYMRSELNDLLKFIQCADIEPVLVAPASGDVEDFSDVAKIFTALGVRRMITTRIDAARRLGGLIVAADTANIALAQISITPYVAKGLSSINPLSLARLLIEVPSAKVNVTPKLNKKPNGKPKEAAR
jgi:flagellar biosynthesis protein FlhF